MSMKFLLLAWAAACSARNVLGAPYAVNTTSSTVDSTSRTSSTLSVATTSVYSPASAPSAGTATVTNSANVTRTSSSVITSPASTCCYLWPEGVGINTWWSSSIDLTVATVVTTWLKYNNTIVPGNSTTINIVNTTSAFTSFGMQPMLTVEGVTPTLTTSATLCSKFASDGHGTACTTYPVTYSELTTYTITTDIVSGVPNTLLPSEATLYGATYIDGTNVATFPSQSLTVASPTPFYLFTGMEIYTSWECPVPTTYTSITSAFRVTVDGTPTTTSGFFPTYTYTPLPDGVHAGGYNKYLNVSTIARSFPEGDYSDFNFTSWMSNYETGPQAGEVDAYTFFLASDFAEFFAIIPKVKEAYREIGECTPLMAGGEPTVHVPVNQLTETSHVTLAMTGALSKGSNTPDTEPKSTSDTFAPAETGPLAFKTAQTADGVTLPTSGTADARTTQATVAEQNQETSAAPATTSAGVGDIIASVIGLVPSAAATQQEASTVGQDVAAAAEQAAQQSQASTAAPAAITVGNSLITADSASQFVVGSQTVAAGGPSITQNGNTIAIASSGNAVIVNGATAPIETPVAAAQAQQTAAAEITVGNSVVTANSASEFVVAGQTLSAGGPAVNQDGATVATVAIASGDSAVVVNGETSPIAQAQLQQTGAAAPQITVGGSVVTANSASQFEIGSQTLVAGGPAITIDGSTLSLASAATAVVVNGATTPIVQAQAAQKVPTAQITVGGSTITADSASAFVVGSQTLAPGGSAITVDGSTLSLASAGTAIVVNGATTPIAEAQVAGPTPAAQITVGASTITANSASEFAIGSQTLSPGGAAITVSGSTFSLAPSGTAIVVNGQTSQIAIPQGAQVTFGGEVATPIASGAYILHGGQTLSPEGSSVVISGTTYSLAPSGSVVMNGVTSPIPTAGGPTTGNAGASQGSITELLLPGTTLLPGSTAIVSGTTYSLPATGGGIYVNGKSSALPTASPGAAITLPNGIVATQSLISDLVVGSQTLLPGSAITVSGTTYSLNGSDVVVKAPSTTFTEAASRLGKSSSSRRTSSPTSSATDRAQSTEAASGSSAASTSSQSGATRSIGFLNGMCFAMFSVALVMCWI